MARNGSQTTPTKGIITVTLLCRGTDPLLMNPMTEETLDGLWSGVHPAAQRDAKPDDVAAGKVMADDSERIVIPADNLFSCLVEAGRRVKYVGRSNISTASSTMLPEFFTLVSEELVLIDADGKPFGKGSWVVDKRRGRNPKDGVAVCIIRPKFPKWAFKVTFEINETKISETKVRELFEIAGAAIGLCDFRPGCKGRFGRFEPIDWVVEKRRAVEANFKRTDLTEKMAA